MLLLAAGFWFATRLSLTLWSWPDAEMSLPALLQVFAVGFLYDLAFYAYALIPVSLYLLLVPGRLWRSRGNAIVVHLLIIGTLFGLGFIAVAEHLFWDEFSVRFNFISVDYLVYRREVADNILESYPLAPILTALLLVSIALWWWLKPRIDRTLQCEMPFRPRLAVSLLLWLAPVLAFALVGQQARMVGDNTYQHELAGNGPYQFFAAFRNNELDYKQFYPTADQQQVASLLRQQVFSAGDEALSDDPSSILRLVHNPGNERRLNVILIMVESLSADYLAEFGNTEGLTPNLDHLIDESLFFTRLYATGTRTTRGLEAVTLSIPPTPGRSIVKRLGRERDMWSLGQVLNDKGYSSQFLYGGRGYFDNMSAFFAGNGYQVIDQSSVPDEEIGFENAWGMADEYLFAQALKQADHAWGKSQPFFFHLMTTSNHRPYTYPANRIDIPSGTSRAGAVKYTDWAIGDFLAKARQKPWFDNTLFVIVADHQAHSAGKTDLPLERYHIPMWFHAPKFIKPGRQTTLASQIDVAPTLLAQLNMDYASSFFGRDILTTSSDDERTLIGNYQHLGLVQHCKLAILSPRQRVRLLTLGDDASPSGQREDATDPLIQRGIAYYQGASTIYKRGLNRWSIQQAAVRRALLERKLQDKLALHTATTGETPSN